MSATPLPFSDFLELLRLRGFTIGLEQYQSVARLCERLGSEFARNRQFLVHSLAGLLSGSQEEELEIERLFAQHYQQTVPVEGAIALHQLQAPAPLAEAAAPGVSQRQRLQRHLAIIIPALILLVVGSGIYCRRYRQPGVHKPPPSPLAGVKPLSGTVDATTQLPPPFIFPELPPPIHVFHPAQAARAAIPPLLLAATVIYLLHRRRYLRSLAKTYWRGVRNALGGTMEPPCDFGALLTPPLAHSDLDDMATILGRSAGNQPGPELDGEKTVSATAARGALTTLVFRKQPAARTVLILCDVALDMRLWRRKTAALCQGLARRGVPVVVRYFAGDAQRVAERPFGATQSLAQLHGQHAHAGLLILSTGTTVYDVNRTGGLPPWIALCQRFHFRVWLHPVLDKRLWRPALRRADFPVRVLPMSRKGLLAAAYDIAQDPEQRRYIADADAPTHRPVTEKDVQQLRCLLAVWPDAPPEFAELIRQKFRPDVPEEVLLHLWASSTDLSGQRLRWSKSELTRWLGQLRARDAHLGNAVQLPQQLEESLRREVLAILGRNEPAAKHGLEYMGWRLQCALQQVYLHDPDDRSRTEALVTLRDLARGPIWEDVADALAPIGMAQAGSRRGQCSPGSGSEDLRRCSHVVLAFANTAARGVAPMPARNVELPGTPRRRFGQRYRPSAWELASMLTTLALVILGIRLQHVGQENFEHVQGYSLAIERSADSSRKVTLIVQRLAEQIPSSVVLCTRADCSQTEGSIQLNDRGESGTIEFLRREVDLYVHVRALLAHGEVAYSQQRLIPSYYASDEGMLAVHFVAGSTRVQGVRYEVTDAAGRYQVGAADQKLSLGPGLAKVAGRHGGYPAFAREVEVPARGLQEISIELDGVQPPGMVKIPAGNFRMGSSEGDDDEKPVHTERVSAFYLDVTEVTMAQYRACVKAGGCTSLHETIKWDKYNEEDAKRYSVFCNVNQQGRDLHPVNCVDWRQAMSYCAWAGKRLPTEAEWEYAARGTDGRKYPWGNEEPRVGRLNACGSECVRIGQEHGLKWKSMYDGDDGWKMTAPVGSFPGDRSAFGVLDMGGNVVEWVQDKYRASYDVASTANEDARSLRCASWGSDDPAFARATNRHGGSHSNRSFFVGFRCAQTR